MPTYEYLCETNGRIVEVAHKMSERVATWGELCARAELPLGPTAAEAPVTKLMSAGFVNSGAAGGVEPRPCDVGQPCCARGGCEGGMA